MPPVRQIQNSFNAGEIGPSVYSRKDIERNKSALKTSYNGYPKPTGGWCNRPGTVKVAQTKSDGQARLVKFVFSTEQAYILEFGDEYVRFFKNRSAILDGASPYEVVSPYAIADVADLKFEYSADTIYITHNSYQTRKLQRYGDTDWRFSYYAPEDGPFLDENVDITSTIQASATTGSIVLKSADEIFTTGHVGALWKLTHYVESQKVNTSFTSASSSTSIPCFTTWRLITHGTWTGKLQIEKSTDGGSTWTVLQSFSGSNDFNPNTSGTEDTSLNLVPFLIRVTVTSYTSGTINVDLSTDAFYQYGIVKITAFTNTKQVTATVLQSLANTTSTFTWSEGAWSDYRGWPAVSRFFQDRLGFFSTLYQQMRWDFTQTSNYDSFRRNQISLLDTDGMSGLLPGRQLNAINGIVGFKSLLAFTSSATWSIASGDGTTFTPNNNKEDVEEYYGSDGIDPVTIGNEAIFVEQHGQTVRNIIFSLANNSYGGADLNVLAKHMVDGKRIIDMAYQRYPSSIIWMVLDDGSAIGLTYMREQEVIAWHRHGTDGLFESVESIPGNGYDEVWFIVNRNGERFIEVLEDRITSDIRYCNFVDCGVKVYDYLDIESITQTSPVRVKATAHGLVDDDVVDINNVLGMTELNGLQFVVKRVDADYVDLYDPITGDAIDGTGYTAYSSGGELAQAFSEFSGLDWLEGKTVSILGNGYELPQQVVTDGKISWDGEYYSCVVVGIPYESDFETLDLEVLNSQLGTTQGRNVRCMAAVFRFLNSLGGYVGTVDEETGNSAIYEAFGVKRDDVGIAPALQSKNRRATLRGDYQSAGRIFYRQKSPYPVEILSVIGEYEIGGVISDAG